jgi:16S rRNA (cytosine1402-N4)-methyltransferase
MNAPTFQHEPVMLTEVLDFLAPQPGETMLDATLGGAGHSTKILERLAPNGTLVGLDRDVEALNAAQTRLSEQESTTIILLHSAFGKMAEILDAHPILAERKFDGFLFDLGVSSHQLDTARGFTFRRDEPLDMRMDATDESLPTASELLRTLPEAEIARILWEYGEERNSRRIARAIVEHRQSGKPLETTAQLVDLVEKSVPRQRGKQDIHPATLTFMGLRIAVNRELEQLSDGLEAAIARMNAGGRIVVLSYHSLEDRIVKQAFAAHAGRVPGASGMSPAAWLPQNSAPIDLQIMTRKPVLPSDEEIRRNPRARSAKLRAAIHL